MIMRDGIQAMPGDYVTFTMGVEHRDFGDEYGIRQGMYVGGETVLFEPRVNKPSKEIRAESISCKVLDRSLYSDTKEWVKEWRAANL